MIKLFILFAVALTLSYTAIAQSHHDKGKAFYYWGWNRGYYSKSDIHFSGNNYDFTLYDVEAKDRQSPFAFNPYFHPKWITLPQCNTAIGYYLGEHYFLTFGYDHMKYVVNQNQTVNISGYIDETNSSYDNSYNNEEIEIKSGFLAYEHTDGLNYILSEFCRNDRILRLKNEKLEFLELNIYEGIGIAGLYPKTNATLLNNPRNDHFYLSGYGGNIKAGLNLTLFKYFFIQSELKGGLINLPRVRTTSNKSDRAEQHFFFFEKTIEFGGIFPLFR